MQHPDRDLIALGVRQPWAELILRGLKTIEIRSSVTKVRGPVYLYSSKKLAEISPAKDAISKFSLDEEKLDRGLLVGTVEIVGCRASKKKDAAASCVPGEYLKGKNSWLLENPVRLEKPLKVRFLPYGIWFYPFKRRRKNVRKKT